MKSIMLAVLLTIASPFAVCAQEADSAPTLQLKHILAPVQKSPGSMATALRAITPILIVPHDFNAPVVCQRAPRVTEALLQFFMQHPIAVNDQRRLDLHALDEQKTQMAAYANRALGLKAVSAVYILEGGKSMTTGVASRLPFKNATSCGPVIEEYEKRLKAAQEAAEAR